MHCQKVAQMLTALLFPWLHIRDTASCSSTYKFPRSPARTPWRKPCTMACQPELRAQVLGGPPAGGGIGELGPATISCRNYYAYQWWKGAARLPASCALLGLFNADHRHARATAACKE